MGKTLELTNEQKDAIEKLTPSHILVFATATPSAPVIGFNTKPSIKFVHDVAKFFRFANTCANVLYIYVNQKTVTGPFHHHIYEEDVFERSELFVYVISKV